MSDEKKSWLDRAGAIHLWKTIEAMLGTKVDKIEGFGLSSNDYTTEEKKKLASLSAPDVATTENNGLMSSADKAKLDGIEAGANNYTHPVYEAKQAGLYRISVDNTGHVATADKMTSEELTAEGVSPADHTHDLSKLVDTLETSADAVEDADTVMVGATVTSDDGSATTKYTRRPLAALWNWIKAKADTLYAAVGHTHNYAGSTEPGGDAIRALAVKDYAGSQTIEIGYASAGLTTTNLTHIAGYTDNGTKIKDVSKDVLKSWIGLESYLPLTGGNMTGNIGYTGTKASCTMIQFIDNTSDTYGNGIAIGGGGATIVGGGEAAYVCGELLSSGGDERLILANDDGIDIYTNCQNGASSATHVTIDANGVYSGTASSAYTIKNQGNATAITGVIGTKGLSLQQVYNNGYPTSYGNVLSIGGDGDGQILAGWSGSNNGIERLYYRNRRDMCST